MLTFNILHKDTNSKARTGIINTAHGEIKTPIFMPVGTLATVKGIHQHELKNSIDADIILANTYHLYLRPTTDVLEKAKGIHSFMNWERPILTDSGGYQVYSLSGRRKINEEGVIFQSHIDGSYHNFTPENVIEIQQKIGADIIMAFDECPPYPCDYSYAKNSMELTHRWLTRCFTKFKNSEPLYGYSQTLFPIVQGSVYKDLRKKSAEFIASQNAEGNAIGGLSVGEPADEMYAMTEEVCNILPVDKPRYLMGVGTPQNLLENIALGVDMFDCVMPTRNGRNGMLFTENGTINIKNKKWADDFSPLDETNDVFPKEEYSKAYVRHLFTVNEMLGKQILSLYNVNFYLTLMKKARMHLEKGDFYTWKEMMVRKMNKRL